MFFIIFKYIILALYYPYIYYLRTSKKTLHEIFYLLESKIYGKLAFSTMISFISPYSGSINPIVDYFDKNITKCYINEQRNKKSI